jgi:predicted exporter
LFSFALILIGHALTIFHLIGLLLAVAAGASLTPDFSAILIVRSDE